MGTRRKKVTVQVVGSLLLSKETWIEFQVPDGDLAQTWLLGSESVDGGSLFLFFLSHKRKLKHNLIRNIMDGMITNLNFSLSVVS